MLVLGAAAGFFLILLVLWDAFETIVLPRRASSRVRLTRLFYRATWPPFRAIGRLRRAGTPRENLLSVFGPLSLLGLLGTWALTLVLGFGLAQWGFRSQLAGPPDLHGFEEDLYMSGTNFFTLGLGDVTPRSRAARILTVIEGGTGFGFLALVLSYLPILAQAFSRRESSIALLDARAGSPPTAAELFRRNPLGDGDVGLSELLREWERWSAEVLESHISFPVLVFYRSQHDNQSWVAALTTLLDTCALAMAGVCRSSAPTARLTFAMARHAVVDLSQVLGRVPVRDAPDRLPPAELERLRGALDAAGRPLPRGAAADEKLVHLRGLYEPYAHALSRFLLMPLPGWLPPEGAKDNWQTTA